MPYTPGYGISLWYSKIYPFSTYHESTPAIADSLRPGPPTKCLVLAEYTVPTDINGQKGGPLRIKVDFGGPAMLTVLNTGTSPIDRIGEEINLSGYIAASGPWYVRLIVETDNNILYVPAGSTTGIPGDAPPEDPSYARTEYQEYYFYKNRVTGRPEVRREPVSTPSGWSPTGGVDDYSTNIDPYSGNFAGVEDVYQPLGGVQVIFKLAGTNDVVEIAVSDNDGYVGVLLPPSAFDVEFHGWDFGQDQWLKGKTSLVKGSGGNVSLYGGLTANDLAQAAEFGAVRAAFSSLRWAGYMVVEDFTSARQREASARDLSTEGEDIVNLYTGLASAKGWSATGNNGKMFGFNDIEVELVAIAMDPSPEII